MKAVRLEPDLIVNNSLTINSFSLSYLISKSPYCRFEFFPILEEENTYVIFTF